MNIYVQTAGLAIALLVLVFFLTRRSLKLYKLKLFKIVIGSVIISLLLDIGSIVGIHYRDSLPEFLVSGICKGYLAFLLFTSWAGLIYVLAEVWPTKKHLKFLRLSAIGTLLEVIAIFIVPIDIFEDGMVVYSHGAAASLTYVFCLINIASTLFIAVTFFKKCNPRRMFAITLWQIIWIFCAIIQLIFKSFLLVGFAGAVGCLILYVLLENPDNNLDKDFSCFNAAAFREWTDDLIKEEKSFYCVEIATSKISLNDIETSRSASSVIKELAELAKFKEVEIFRHSETGFISVSTDRKQSIESKEVVLRLLSNFGYIREDVTTVFIDHAEGFESGANILHYLNDNRERVVREPEKYLEVGDKQIKDFLDENKMQIEIDDALAEDRIEVFYQPIVNVQSGRLELAEALVRIRDKNGSYISPAKFIPLSEHTGQAIAIGQRVFEKVCQFINRHSLDDMGIRAIDINLSANQCDLDTLSDDLIRLMRQYRTKPQYINLEITESAAVNSHVNFVNNINALVKYGVAFSLDDFGKGQSNLDYIIHTPLSCLKIDFELTQAYFSNSKAKAAFEMIVGLADKLGVYTVAEGIETERDVQEIKRAGIDYVQGYFYSKPLPEDQFIKFVSSFNQK